MSELAAPVAVPVAVPAAVPAVVPAVEPAAAPPVDVPGTYKTDFSDPDADKIVHETVVNGQRVPLTGADIDNIAAIVAEQAARETKAAATPAATPPPKKVDDKPPEKTENEKALEKRIDELNLKIDSSAQRQNIKEAGSLIEKNLVKEIDAHQVFKDYPGLKDLAKEQAMALLSANARTGMTEKVAVEQVAAKQGAALNAAREKYITGKLVDATTSEAQPGGAQVASPGPKLLDRKDLMRGRVRVEAAKRLAAKSVT